ncbi:MAG: 1-acyl-sn-glycerol-3-phosphate acyltransferase [Elusimicrobia bacterium]|nr:1-acyl-sn-glycerol-3-phosphate acyltransferase [Elusimicrobiota bacterium]
MKEFKKPLWYQKILYRLVCLFVRILGILIWRMEVSGTENVPLQGGALLASNHSSLADPPLLGSSAPRSIYFFAKEELFQVPLLGWLIRQLNAFPVKRFEHDVGAFKRAQFLLKSGQAVVLFPEGRRSKTGEIGKAKPGVGMLAYKAGVPVVPVYILHSNCLKEFRKIRVHYGKPLYPPPSETPKDQYQPFSDAVLEAVAALKSKMYN